MKAAPIIDPPRPVCSPPFLFSPSRFLRSPIPSFAPILAARPTSASPPRRRREKFYGRFGKARVFSFALKLLPAFYPSGGRGGRRGRACSGRPGVGTEEAAAAAGEERRRTCPCRRRRTGTAARIRRGRNPPRRRRLRRRTWTRSRLAPTSASATSATSTTSLPRRRPRCRRLSAGTDGIHVSRLTRAAVPAQSGGERICILSLGRASR